MAVRPGTDITRPANSSHLNTTCYQFARGVRPDGFDVIQVGDGFEALTVLKEGHDELALVLLDLMMPRLSGEEVLTVLEHVALTAPIILTSGFNRHEMSRRFAGRGVSGFLQKPYDLTEVQATVGNVLKAAALLRAATPPAG